MTKTIAQTLKKIQDEFYINLKSAQEFEKKALEAIERNQKKLSNTYLDIANNNHAKNCTLAEIYGFINNMNFMEAHDYLLKVTGELLIRGQ